MIMKKNLTILLIIFGVQWITAQYTEIINSKRPGFSESPYSIGSDVFQFESGIFYRTGNSEMELASQNTMGGELFFRYGKFLEKLEFNANIAYQKDELNNLSGENFSVKGLSDLTIGAKYLLYQQEFTDKSKEIRSWKKRMAFDKKRLIPSVGVYVGVHTNFLGKDYKDEGISYKGAILLQHDFSDRLVLLTNLIADKITSEDKSYQYLLTMTYAITTQWSYFIENQGIFKDTNAPAYHFGTGIAYLYSNNLQFDASVRTNFFDNYSFLYSSIGVAWRIDRHSDEIIPKNSPAAPLYKKGKKSKRGGFFSRLFKKKN